LSNKYRIDPSLEGTNLLKRLRETKGNQGSVNWVSILSRRLMPPHVRCVGGAGVERVIRRMRNCRLCRKYKILMAVPVWAEGLTRYGLYYAGIVDESQLDKILEVHKRGTVSTFGTRSSRRVTKKTTKEEPSKDDCSASRPSNDQSGSTDNTITTHQVSKVVTACNQEYCYIYQCRVL